ncbi:PAAR domain-containing protein [Photobacterium iliopiscarium]|uniref:PAAR domain-containing protein n=1 Tax=Photobacterium iliopiscarium TaxID=56192 RepID=A0ABX5GM59_9GAMM|nr:PAAR domain-containing protein [Photobacterium iliopiscarium]PSW91248.1 PAAR domain-containing protein [Photobacterium iliopiscarium]
MSNDVITVGSATSTGGKVVSGNSGMVVNYKSIALVGDMATCTCGSKSCRGQGGIVATSPRNANVNGVLFAKAGDLVDTGCGSCFLLPSEHGVSLGVNVGCSLNVGSGISFGNGVNINQVSGAPLTETASLNKVEITESMVSSLYDRKVVVKNASDQPIANCQYKIELENGEIVEGYTNELGEVNLIQTDDTSQLINLYVKE